MKSKSLFVAERTTHATLTNPKNPNGAPAFVRERIYVEARGMADACATIYNKDGMDPVTVRQATNAEQRIWQAFQAGHFLSSSM